MFRLPLALLLTSLAIAWPGGGARPEIQAEDVGQLIRDLGSANLETEGKARRALARLGKASLPALRQAAQGAPDTVTRERAGHLADTIDKLLAGELRGFAGHTEAVNSVAFSPDGRQVLPGSDDRTMRLWDRATGQEQRQFPLELSTPMAVAFSPDGKRIASAHWDSVVRVWAVATGKEELCCRGHQDFVTSAAWSPDGRHVLSGSHDGYMKLWGVATGKEVRSFAAGSKVPDKPGAREEISSVAISPDGTKALSAGSEGLACFWDLRTGKLLSCLPRRPGHIKSALFSPDGKRVLSGDEDGLIRLCEAQTGRELRRFAGRLYPKDRDILGKNNRSASVFIWAFSPGRSADTFGARRPHGAVVGREHRQGVGLLPLAFQ